MNSASIDFLSGLRRSARADSRHITERCISIASLLNSRVCDIRHFFFFYGPFYGMLLAAAYFEPGSYLYAPRLRVSPVTMPIYLAPSLPLSCEISYNSFMQISRGGSAPLNPNGVISNFTIHQLRPLFFAQTSRNEPRTVIPSFTSSGWRARGSLSPLYTPLLLSYASRRKSVPG